MICWINSWRWNKKKCCFILSQNMDKKKRPKKRARTYDMTSYRPICMRTRPMGIHEFIQRAFFPLHWTWESLLKDSLAQSSEQHAASCRRHCGVSYGLTIHRAMAKRADFVRKQQQQGDCKANGRMNKSIYADAIFGEVKTRGWKVIGAEVGARWGSFNIETRADLICEDAEKHAIVIELKTTRHHPTQLRLAHGVFRSLRTANGQQVPFHLLNAYALQLLCTSVMLGRSWSLSSTPRGYLLFARLLANRKVELTWMPMAGWMLDDNVQAAVRLSLSTQI